jgi:hypothetical protein
MANESVKTSNLGITTTLSANDRVVVLTNPATSAQTQTITLNNFAFSVAGSIPYANVTNAGVFKVGGGLAMSVGGVLTAPVSLATSSSPGVVQGDGNTVIIDSNGNITVDYLHLKSDILPNVDNTYNLGSASKRFASVHIGPGTLYIQDQSNSSLNAQLTVNNGILQINGANQLQVGQLKFIDNTIQSLTDSIDIQIGNTASSAKLVLNRNTVMASGKTITFGDSTTQNTAYIPNVITPRIISGIANTVTIDFSKDTTIHLHTNAGTVTANLINFTAGKQVDVIIYNNIGGTQQYNHGLSTSNRAVGGSSFFLCSHPTMWVTYICGDNTETNCFVKAAV